MPRFKLSNGVKVQFTAEEEAQRDAEEQAWSDDTHNRKMRSLREERNRLLSECDWTDLPNSALTEEKKNEWKRRHSLMDADLNTVTPHGSQLPDVFDIHVWVWLAQFCLFTNK